MPDEFAGRLFKHILSYVNDEDPQTDDFALKMAFEPIKQQLKRDLEKYENIRKRNAVNGSMGGRPKKPKKPSGLSGNPEKPKKADTVIDTVTDIDTGIKSSSIKILEEPRIVEELFLKFPDLSKPEIEIELEKMVNWCKANGKRKKDYVAFAKNWLTKTEAKKKLDASRYPVPVKKLTTAEKHQQAYDNSMFNPKNIPNELGDQE